MTTEFITKDSGAREGFPTGSVRDCRTGKGRFDLIPSWPLRCLAQLYERGAAKYSAENWKKGQPLRRYLDSSLRHINELLAGDMTEDHAAAACWNLFSFMWTRMMIAAGLLPKDLDDMPEPEPQYRRGAE
jgi:hypothetical protein